MYGVSKISSEQNIMLTTFPGAQYSAQSLAEHLDVFAKAGIVVDMICQSAPRGTAVDFSFTTSYDNFAAVMKALPAAAKSNPPLVSGGYSKINLFGEEMVTSCGVAARALAALAGANIEITLITTSDLDISLLIRQQDEDAAFSQHPQALPADLPAAGHPQHHQPPGQRPHNAGLVQQASVPEGNKRTPAFKPRRGKHIGKMRQQGKPEQPPGIPVYIPGMVISLRNEITHDGAGDPAYHVQQQGQRLPGIPGKQPPGYVIQRHGGNGNKFYGIGA